jgi:hypothetical protein
MSARKVVAWTLQGLGFVLVPTGWILSALLGLLVTYVTIREVVGGHVGAGLEIFFGGWFIFALIAGAIEFFVSGLGALLIALGERLETRSTT